MAECGITNRIVPDEVPKELPDLTVLEQQPIARAHPIAMAHRKNGGQYGYSGHVINFAQGIATFVPSLHWSMNSEGIPVTVVQPPDEYDGECKGRDSTACTPRVQRALVYLIAHHPGCA